MPRVLFFLFDGTGNDPTEADCRKPTNIFLMNSLISDTRREGNRFFSQVTFYFPGVGTKFYSTLQSVTEVILDKLFAHSIDDIIMRAYLNLVSNFRKGDEIVVLGFSRGAVVARVFSRLICDFGVLSTQYIQKFAQQIKAFNNALTENFEKYMQHARSFRENNTEFMEKIDNKVKFLGLFDCVHGPADKKYINFLRNIDRQQSDKIAHYVHLMSLHDVRSHFILSRLMPLTNTAREVWQPGVHSDVGGGYEQDLISRISLLTMVDYLNKFANVSVIRPAYQQLCQSISHDIAFNRVKINLEDKIESFLKYRSEYFYGESERFHHFHKYLVGRPVDWKDEGAAIYENRYLKRIKTCAETQRTMKGILLKAEQMAK